MQEISQAEKFTESEPPIMPGEFEPLGDVHSRHLLFRVFDGDRLYSVYTNGDVSGFSDNAVVANYYPGLLRYHQALNPLNDYDMYRVAKR